MKILQILPLVSRKSSFLVMQIFAAMGVFPPTVCPLKRGASWLRAPSGQPWVVFKLLPHNPSRTSPTWSHHLATWHSCTRVHLQSSQEAPDNSLMYKTHAWFQWRGSCFHESLLAVLDASFANTKDTKHACPLPFTPKSWQPDSYYGGSTLPFWPECLHIKFQKIVYVRLFLHIRNSALQNWKSAV